MISTQDIQVSTGLITEMIKKIIEANSLYDFFSDTKDITVALSGGADSVALLYALNSLKKEYGFELYAAHYNHGIRGKEADKDQEFAENFCKSLNIPFFTEKGDVINFARETKQSLELSARKMRYDFLSRVAKGKIATAHTASDNIETIIFNLARGTSLNGIKGIPPKRDNIIRPLILCSRDEIEDYIKENNLSFVTDSTNLTDDCSRNIIRHKIVPILKDINSACIQNATRLSVLLNEDNDYLKLQAEKEFKDRLKNNGLSLKDFDKLSLAISKRVIILFYKCVLGTEPDNYHTEKLYDVCTGKIKRTSIIESICGENKHGFLVFSKIKEPDVVFKTDTEIISIENFNKGKNVHELFLNSAIDYDKIIGEIRKVEKNSSDLIKLANSNSTKTLKKLLTEKKIPICERKNLPVFADDNGIIWCYKVGSADRVKIDKSTKTVLYFKTEKTGENINYGNY